MEMFDKAGPLPLFGSLDRLELHSAVCPQYSHWWTFEACLLQLLSSKSLRLIVLFAEYYKGADFIHKL